MTWTFEAYAAVLVFLLAYGLIVAEKVHRTVVAMTGAALLLGLGVLDQDTALHHIDFNTIGLLVGMMILVGVTAETGLFRYLAVAAAKRAGGDPVRILLLFSLITAVTSAFLDNVTTVLLMVPVTFSVTRQLGISPLPFLIAQIIASNVGGTATLIGDPPNIMIGSAVRELTFIAFIENLTPIVALIMAAHLPLFVFMFRRDLRADPERMKRIRETDTAGLIEDRGLLVRCLIVLGLTITGFFLHHQLRLESATIALTGAFLLLLTAGEKRMEEAFAKVEWTTLFFFIGLFVVVGGLVETGVIRLLAEKAVEWTGGDVFRASMLILWMSAVLSAFVDNIPFVATMIPLIQEMGTSGVRGDLEPVWWSLALGACLGGNGTLIGASANLVVAGLAGREGCPITFMKYLKYGAPLTLLSIALSAVYIGWRYFWS
ncbi:MAG: hypothetical protein BLM47_08275 [Candidatus Reconcilbacillus cellulovorans]|uniref:Citrate transporter-like domain-containing protein n=1 Tax=Candidatus Reconcilbacillus cellulovorans TaxID=1906605 RepID=A0A2A6E0F5_9BACL|nr:MAG: hypothetical protein BLM47_08275 [Candidatus Reconcilbacillus cellulovorans]